MYCRPCGDGTLSGLDAINGVVSHRRIGGKATLACLRDEKRLYRDNYETQLTSVVNGLRGDFPGAPKRLLWAVAEFDQGRGEKARWNRKAAERVQHRINRLLKRRALKKVSH